MTQPFNILVVDDDPTVIGLLGNILQDVGRLRFATSGPDALRMARQTSPDLVLLDIEMPGMGGFEVFKAMKELPPLAEVPIIFITSHDDADHEVTGLALGAADFICKPPRAARVVARVRMHLRMKQMADALRNAAYIDGLTGVANRRQFEETLQREWLRAQRSGAPVSLLLIDIDHFKKFNDHYGHPAGDRCLQQVAQCIGKVVQRPADLAARYGGEEFVVLLPDTDASGARFLALHLLQAVQALQIPHAASPVAGHVSLSVGVSSWEDQRSGWSVKLTEPPVGAHLLHPPAAELVCAADRALYAAKQAGRNQSWYLPLGEVLQAGEAGEAAVPAATAAPSAGSDLRAPAPPAEVLARV